MKVSGLRWLIATLLFLACGLSFFDRQVLSVLAPKITADLKMDNVAYSWVVFAFILSYIIAVVLHKTVGLRVTEEDELTGLDLSLHGEAGYHLSEDALSMATVGHEGLPDARGTADPAMAG